MRELGNFLGWITVYVFAVAILNFFIKFVFKRFITPWIKEKPSLSKKYNKLINIYKIVMKYVVRYHKVIGGLAIITLIFHLLIELQYSKLSITGVAAGILMAIVIVLGTLGATIFKSKKTRIWLTIHRVVSFALIIFIMLHLAIKV